MTSLHFPPFTKLNAIFVNGGKIKDVETLALSQEDLPQTHRTQRQMAREVGISQYTVNRIVKKDLRLICMKNVGHMN